MRLIENMPECEILHESLVSHDPWGGAENDKFIGKFVLSEELSEDFDNVTIYHFDVHELIDDFIDTHEDPETGKISISAKEMSKTIISDLERMTALLRSKTEG